MQMCYGVPGQGNALIVLHGAYLDILAMCGNIPRPAGAHQVHAIEMQAHGRTSDIGRPVNHLNLADDAAACMDAVRLLN